MTADELAVFVRALWAKTDATSQLPFTLDSVKDLSLLGATADAARLHGLIGPHNPEGCPICMPQALPATSGDVRSATDAIVEKNLAAVGLSRGDIEATFETLLTEAKAGIPFFEHYANDPDMSSQQWADFQALYTNDSNPPTQLLRLIYDLIRTTSLLLRYLTGEIQPS